MRRSNFSIIGLFSVMVLIVLACHKESINQIPVGLKVGDTELSQVQVHIILHDDMKYFTKQYKQPYTYYQMEQRARRLVDDAVLYDYALANGYDNNTEIDEQWYAYHKHYAIQEFSLHRPWEVEAMAITDFETRKVYNQLKNTYFLRVVRIHKDTMPESKVLQTLTNKTDFEKLWADMDYNFYRRQFAFTWPYEGLEYAANTIQKLKTGQLSNAIETGNVLTRIIVDSVVSNKRLLPYDKVKKNISSRIEKIRTDTLYNLRVDSIAMQIDLSIDSNAVKEYIELLTSDEMQVNLSLDEAKELLDKQVLATYILDGKKRQYTIDDLYTHIDEMLYKDHIVTEYALKYVLKVFIANEILYDEILQKGYMDTKKLISEFANLKMRLTLQTFEKEEISTQVQITPEMVRESYEKSLDSLTDGGMVVLSRFDFKEAGNAQKCYMSLMKKQNYGKPLIIPANAFGAFSYLSDYELGINDITIPEKLKYQLFELPDTTILQPVSLSEGNYTVIMKKYEKGNRYKTYDEVKGQIEQELYKKEYNRLRQEIINSHKQDVKIDKRFNEAELYESFTF